MEAMQGLFGSFTGRRDRRRHSRKSPTSIIYVQLGIDTGGIVLDLGKGGLAMTTANPINEKYYPHIRFELPNCSHLIETAGHVIWISESKNRVGIHFVDLRESMHSHIEDWISSELSPNEIPETLRPIQKKRKHLEMPLPAGTRVQVLARQTVRGIDETISFDDLFPSESSPTYPPEIHEKVNDEVEERPSTLTHDALHPTHSHYSGSILGLGLGASNAAIDRSGPTIGPRSRFLFVAYEAMIGVTCFAIGVAAGNGFFHRSFLDIEKLISREDKPASEIAAPPAPSIGQPAVSSPIESPQQTSGTSAVPSLPLPAPDHIGLQNNAVVRPDDSNAMDPPKFAEAPEINFARTQGSKRTMLVTPPSEGSRPMVLTLPEEAVSASPSFAISSQTSISLPPEPGADSYRQPERLTVGELIFHVDPRFSGLLGREGPESTIKLRATVSDSGGIIDIKPISGPAALYPPAMSAIREWRYRPTILNGQPIKTQEDILIAFRGH